MAKYLIEVSHDAQPLACLMAVQLLQKTGSHFLTHADFGCLDGIHKCWVTVDVDSRDEARNLLPPAYRPRATIVQLNKFSLEQIDELLKHHESEA